MGYIVLNGMRIFLAGGSTEDDLLIPGHPVAVTEELVQHLEHVTVLGWTPAHPTWRDAVATPQG